MTQQELLDYCIEMQRRGERYQTIAAFLNRQNADDLATKTIFRELDKIDKANKLTESTKLPISWSRLIAGFLLSCLGIYYLILAIGHNYNTYHLARLIKVIIPVTILGIVGLALFIGECAKLIINLNRK
jgi:hypothetical protein